MKITKLIAPIFITVFLVMILVCYFFVWLLMPIPTALKILLLFILIALVGLSIYNLYERIQEVRSGEEDDLSKY